ncbi:hypothetical protein L9F63_004860, partial [Diploptera punctata]
FELYVSNPTEIHEFLRKVFHCERLNEVLECSNQHCLHLVASDMEVIVYLVAASVLLMFLMNRLNASRISGTLMRFET